MFDFREKSRDHSCPEPFIDLSSGHAVKARTAKKPQIGQGFLRLIFLGNPGMSGQDVSSVVLHNEPLRTV